MANKFDVHWRIIRFALQKTSFLATHYLPPMNTLSRWLRKIIYYCFIDLLGFRAIRYKLFPPSIAKKEQKNYRPPATFGIWFFSLYFALYGFATARYERLLDRAEFKYGILTTELSAGMTFDCEMVKRMGNTSIPYEPNVYFFWGGFSSPWSNFIEPILKSLFSDEEYFKQFHIMKNNVLSRDSKPCTSSDEFVLMMAELWKDKLSNANLSNTDLSNADLSNANLSNANFTNTILINAKLSKTNLTNANFDGANLMGANLINANLKNSESFSANYSKANLLDANLSFASFINADFSSSNLTGAKLFNTDIGGAIFNNATLENVSFSINVEEQLSKVKTLYEAKGLNPYYKISMQKKFPKLFALQN